MRTILLASAAMLVLVPASAAAEPLQITATRLAAVTGGLDLSQVIFAAVLRQLAFKKRDFDEALRNIETHIDDTISNVVIETVAINDYSLVLDGNVNIPKTTTSPISNSSSLCSTARISDHCWPTDFPQPSVEP